MPLPLTFGKPPAGVKKLLDSISEENEDDSDSTLSSASPKAKSIDYSARPKSSNVNTLYPSKTNDDSSRKSEQRSANLINSALSVPSPSGTINHDTLTNDISELKMSIKQLIEAQRHQQSTGETCNAILQHMLSSKEELAILHHDIKQLHSNHGGESSQPLDMINDRLQLLADELKSSNAEHRESILSLKASAENERKALQAQLSNERLISSNLRNELEKEMECQTMEKNKLEIEKDKLARQWKQLERSEALFEQRKMAASEGIENAERMMSMIRSAEARLNTEMERLVHLSDYVREKDIRAQEQLEHARDLTNKLLEIDVSRDEFFENAEKNQQEMSESRMIIARERVAMLKERVRERERCLVGGSIGKRQ